ncbi:MULTISPECIES: hypothetical protein [Streptomyces]|uniref:hypothetical protein n=1 Tax=Streptomyces TaxID=1883 RepID=UPI000AD4872D|nr:MULTISPECIES: hypothetical protein [Streptomyces]
MPRASSRTTKAPPLNGTFWLVVGHGDNGVAMKIYAHALLDKQGKALRKLGDALS